MKLFGTAAGGGHHVVTKRRLMMDYAIKGLNPFAQDIITTTRDSYYLKGQSSSYPTALLDFDGNERSSVHFRDPDLNLLQIILQQLQSPNLAAPLRKALVDQLFQNHRRATSPSGRQGLTELTKNLALCAAGLSGSGSHAPPNRKSLPKRMAMPDGTKRPNAFVSGWTSGWGRIARIQNTSRRSVNLLALRKETFNAAKLKIPDLISPASDGRAQLNL